MKYDKIVTETHKECTKCRKMHLHEDFRVTKRNEDGTVRYRASWCKFCSDEAELEKKGGRVKPIPIVLEDSKECLMCHEILHVGHFSPASRGRLGRAAYCRKCMAQRTKSVEGYKEKHCGYVRAYRKRNTYKWRAMHRIHQFNRRSAIKATDDGTVTVEFLETVYNTEHCYWCQQFTEFSERSIEHIVELSAGGAHSASNITMACKSCNFARKGKNNGRNEGQGQCCEDSEGQY